MSVARVDPEGPDVPVERIRHRQSLTIASGETGAAGAASMARRKWREWFGDATYERPPDSDFPLTRAECLDMPRPCPFVSCSHHLYLDANPETGALTINFPHLSVDQMRETCSLDIADRGGATLDEVGKAVGVTRERIRQYEEVILRKLKDHDAELERPAARGEGYEVRVPRRR